jgi:hypothetical protein
MLRGIERNSGPRAQFYCMTRTVWQDFRFYCMARLVLPFVCWFCTGIWHDKVLDPTSFVWCLLLAFASQVICYDARMMSYVILIWSLYDLCLEALWIGWHCTTFVWKYFELAWSSRFWRCKATLGDFYNGAVLRCNDAMCFVLHFASSCWTLAPYGEFWPSLSAARRCMTSFDRTWAPQGDVFQYCMTFPAEGQYYCDHLDHVLSMFWSWKVHVHYDWESWQWSLWCDHYWRLRRTMMTCESFHGVWLACAYISSQNWYTLYKYRKNIGSWNDRVEQMWYEFSQHTCFIKCARQVERCFPELGHLLFTLGFVFGFRTAGYELWKFMFSPIHVDMPRWRPNRCDWRRGSKEQMKTWQWVRSLEVWIDCLITPLIMRLEGFGGFLVACATKYVIRWE